MFTHTKKDFYSVNANISMSPVRQSLGILEEAGNLSLIDSLQPCKTRQGPMLVNKTEVLKSRCL